MKIISLRNFWYYLVLSATSRAGFRLTFLREHFRKKEKETCSLFTIKMQLNSTITVFDQGLSPYNNNAINLKSFSFSISSSYFSFTINANRFPRQQDTLEFSVSLKSCGGYSVHKPTFSTGVHLTRRCLCAGLTSMDFSTSECRVMQNEVKADLTTV